MCNPQLIGKEARLPKLIHQETESWAGSFLNDYNTVSVEIPSHGCLLKAR
jgi:hypothetical protein